MATSQNDPRPASRAVNADQTLGTPTDLHKPVGFSLGNLYQEIDTELILQSRNKHGEGDLHQVAL